MTIKLDPSQRPATGDKELDYYLNTLVDLARMGEPQHVEDTIAVIRLFVSAAVQQYENALEATLVDFQWLCQHFDQVERIKDGMGFYYDSPERGLRYYPNVESLVKVEVGRSTAAPEPSHGQDTE